MTNVGDSHPQAELVNDTRVQQLIYEFILPCQTIYQKYYADVLQSLRENILRNGQRLAGSS